MQKLKILTSTLTKTEKVKLYEKNFKDATKGVLSYLDISDLEYETIKGKTNPTMNKGDSSTNESKSQNPSKEKETCSEIDNKSTSIISRCQLVLSSRSKPIEELPPIQINKHVNAPKTPTFTPKVKPRAPSKLVKGKQKAETNEIEITDYLKEGEILYPKLIKDEINKFDKELLVQAKKANSIGGKDSSQPKRGMACHKLPYCRHHPDPCPA